MNTDSDVLIGVSANWGNLGNYRDPRTFVAQELQLLEDAEELGYDAIFSPEHHFDWDYCACPDNFLPLAYLAGRTSRIKLGLGAIILPWNDPLRVVEKVAFLDHMTGGRLLIGFGRGLAKREYAGFGVDMSESRGRFDEAAAMVLNGLRSGVVQGNGPFYPQAPVPVYPPADASVADRLYSVGMSPDSALVAGDLGAALLCFVTGDLEGLKPLIGGYRRRFLERHGVASPPEVLVDFAYVHPDAEEAARVGAEYAGRYYQTVVSHYNFDGTHFAETKGYEAYADGAAALREYGVDAATDAYVASQAGIGTPQQVIENYRRRREVLGNTSIMSVFQYGAMPYETASASMELFATEVMPALREMFNEPVPAGVASVEQDLVRTGAHPWS